ncbi:MAG: phage integrase SAM-like domain-containing protein [Planctomycetia bacterium]|nr:phage integrase SAM-like domain-containing protein [Planctomycetia bacterium]
MKPNPETTQSEATQWHRRPVGDEVGPCSICGAPTRTVDHRRIGEHRAAAADEGVAAGWIARRKSPSGWVFLDVCDRSEVPRQRAQQQRKIKAADTHGAGVTIKRVSHARRNSLVRHYHHDFVPAKLADKSPDTGRQYERALCKLCEFLGRDATIGEVNEGVIDRFVEWAIREGLSFETVRKYRAYIRRVVRHAQPGSCPKETGKRPHEQERVGVDDSELDVEGSLWRFFHETYRPLRMAGRADVSAMHYVFTLRRLARQFGRSVLVTDLSNELVAGHLQWMLDNGLSAFTANSVRGDLLALWRLAHKRHLVAASPDVDKLPTPKRQPQAWSLDELGRIFDACHNRKGMVGMVPAAAWWLALVSVLYDTGIRKRAVLSIVVPAESQKQNADQSFRISTETTEAILAIWQPSRQLLFPWPWRPDKIWEDFGKILEAAELPNTSRDKFHKIRRTTATQIAVRDSVEGASRQLGHSSEAMTKRYIDPRFLQSRDATEFLPRPKRSNL